MKKLILSMMFLCFSMVMFANQAERPPTDELRFEQSIEIEQNVPVIAESNLIAYNCQVVVEPIMSQGVAIASGGILVQTSYTNKSTLFKNSIAGKYSYETNGISQLNAIHNIASTRFYQDNKTKRMNRPIVVYSNHDSMSELNTTLISDLTNKQNDIIYLQLGLTKTFDYSCSNKLLEQSCQIK